MDPNTPGASQSFFELNIDHESSNHFRETSKWTAFIAIVYFVIIGLVLCVLVIAGGSIIEELSSMIGDISIATGIIVTIAVFILAILFATYFLLYRFAYLTRSGIERQDQLLFNKGLKALKNYFIIYGILMVLGLLGSFIATTVSLF